MPANICPGCHFGCEIEDFQCARGEKLHARWVETGSLPERRGPGQGPVREKDHKGPAFTVDDRLMHMLHIVGIALQDLADESGSSDPDKRALDCLIRHDLAASAMIVEGRTHLPNAEETLDAAVAQGLVAKRAHGETTLYELTETGLETARTWEAERKTAEAEFLGVLSDDEKDQLLALVMKVLEPGFKRRGIR